MQPVKSDFQMNFSHESILLVNHNSLNYRVIVIAVSFLFGPGPSGGLGLALICSEMALRGRQKFAYWVLEQSHCMNAVFDTFLLLPINVGMF